MRINVKLDNPKALPVRAHATDAGLDLYSLNDVEITMGMSRLIDTGVAMEIPVGYAGFVFNRSSQGKLGIVIANGTGIIDSDYRGNIKVLLKNTSSFNYQIKAFETRIAQLVLMPILLPELNVVFDLDTTERGIGGFGSTGV